MRIARAPFGLVSGGVGAIRWRSGCTRAAASRQPWHRPQGGAPASRLGSGHPPTAPASRPPVQSNAWANASAVVIRPAPVGPTNAYACTTRSVASARRRRATARGWSRIASSATQEVLDERAYLRGDHGRGLGRAHKPHALGLRAPDLQVAPPHAPVEGERLTLEAVAPPAADPPEPLDGIEVEVQREVGQDAAGRPDIQLADQVGVDAAPVALVRHGRVGVAVAEHDAAALEPRADLLCDVLVARGHEQEDLDERFGPDARMLEQAAHGDPEARPVGLTGPLDSAPFGAEPTSEAPHLGRLARPLDALERDEHSTHVQILRVRRYATLARRPAAYGVALCDDRARPARASRDRPAVQMWLMVSRSEGTRSRSRPRSRMWRARWRPPRPKASARASTSPPKRMPKATRIMPRPIPISVSAVANANSSTSHRAARARSRASGRPALTAAISAACPRKFAASQPTTRISSAESARGSRYISIPVAPGAPGIARASIPMVAKITKTPQNTMSRRSSDGVL